MKFCFCFWQQQRLYRKWTKIKISFVFFHDDDPRTSSCILFCYCFLLVFARIACFVITAGCPEIQDILEEICVIKSMSKVFYVPGLLFLNGALKFHKLKQIVFHTNAAKDKLLKDHNCKENSMSHAHLHHMPGRKNPILVAIVHILTHLNPFTECLCNYNNWIMLYLQQPSLSLSVGFLCVLQLRKMAVVISICFTCRSMLATMPLHVVFLTN